MKLLQIALLVAYLLMASCFFTLWLEFFKRDTRFSSEDRYLSIVILVIATILWPLVVPIAYLELLKEKINGLDLTVSDR